MIQQIPGAKRICSLFLVGPLALLMSCGGRSTAAPAPADPAAATITITVSPEATLPISPYIYGVNFAGSAYPAGSASALPRGLTMDRTGGNRYTAYNWETNASNAGSDYHYQNDTYVSSSKIAGAPITATIAENHGRDMASLITVQMQGLVAGDVDGPASTANPPDLSRFKSVVFSKDGAFTLTPSTTDAHVYMDEFLWAIDQRFAGQGIFTASPATRPVFVQLDNEPELWPSTHLEIQGKAMVPADVYIARTIGLATALKKQFPDATLFGPAHYGFYGLYAWQGELSPSPQGGNWFTDKYLAALKTASKSFGRPLVDVYDFHWYPEATDGNGSRVTSLNGANLTDRQVQAIVQSPRSMWDGTFREASWIADTLGGPIELLPRLKQKIAATYPGIKLAITEYHNGGAQHIAGTIAQADALGVFGAQGLFAATLWPLVGEQPYTLAGFRAFRDFDGAGHHFGDTAVRAVSSDTGKVSAYVSTDTTRPGRVVMVAINRSGTQQLVSISGQPVQGTAHLFRMSATSAAGQKVIQPVEAGTQAASGSSLTLSLPALSVTSVDIY